VRIGCSGWNYDDWRGRLYPQGMGPSRWLPRYAEVFDTVEVNATFYRLPSLNGVERWVEQTPDDFVFSVKASRYLTHVRRLRDLGDGLERYYERIEPLVRSGKLGPVVWQLPPNFRRDDERLSDVLAALPPGRHLAVTHPAVVRAAVGYALDAPGAYPRVDVPPLGHVDISGFNGRWNLRVGAFVNSREEVAGR